MRARGSYGSGLEAGVGSPIEKGALVTQRQQPHGAFAGGAVRAALRACSQQPSALPTTNAAVRAANSAGRVRIGTRLFCPSPDKDSGQTTDGGGLLRSRERAEAQTEGARFCFVVPRDDGARARGGPLRPPPLKRPPNTMAASGREPRAGGCDSQRSRARANISSARPSATSDQPMLISAALQVRRCIVQATPYARPYAVSSIIRCSDDDLGTRCVTGPLATEDDAESRASSSSLSTLCSGMD